MIPSLQGFTILSSYRCSLKSKCQSSKKISHDVVDLSELIKSADAKLKAWVQSTENEVWMGFNLVYVQNLSCLPNL